MPNVSLTGIEFTIKGSADKASASVDSLIQKLSNLNAALSNGANAQAFAKGLEGIAKAANSLSDTNITGAKSALEQLSKSMKSFKSFGDSLKGAATFGNAMSKLAAKPENLMQVAEILAKIATIDFTNIKEAGEGLRNIAAAANSLAKIPQATKETGDAAKKANSPLKTFLKSLGRIAFYRIIRGILKSITQAFQEGLKNAYMFDKVAGGGLADALDNLATKSLTMKNQLGAAFGGLLTAIMPVVIQIIKIVTALASAITRLIAILGGNSQWLRAKDVWTEWGDAAEGAGGAAKEALKYLAPFDELNVLPSQRSGGSGGGSDTPYGDMFEWVDTDIGGGFIDSITEAFSKLSDWFQSKDWQDIGGQAWQTLKDIFTDGTAANEAVTSFMEALGSAFGAVIGTVWGFIHDLVEDLAIQFKRNLIDYNGDGKITAVDFLKAVLKTGEDIVDWVYETLVKPFFDGFGRALTGDSSFDFSQWATDNILNPIINAINTAIQGINEAIGTNIPTIPLIATVKKTDFSKLSDSERRMRTEGVVKGTDFSSLPDNSRRMRTEGIVLGTDFSKLHDKFRRLNGIKAVIEKTEDALTEKQREIVATAVLKYQKDGMKKTDKVLTETAVLKYQQDGMKKTEKVLSDYSARVNKVDVGALTKEQRMLNTTANMKYVRFKELTAEQKRMTTTANMRYVRTNDLTAEQRRIKTTANLNGVINSLTDSQKTVSTIASLSSIKKNDGIVDAYGYIRVPTIAKIVGTEGYSMIDLQNSNSGNGFRFSASSPSYSMGNSENEEAMYRAMSRALADSELGGDIELDGEVLYKNVVTRNRANTRLTGVNALA